MPIAVRRILLFGAFLLLVGCGAARPEPLPLSDRAATQASFITAVQAHYELRKRRGVLSEPLVSDNQVRFLFTYNKLWFGRYAEQVELDLITEREGAAPTSYQITASYPKQGSDAEAEGVRQAIIDRMAGREPAKVR